MCIQGYSTRKPILSRFLPRRKRMGRPMAQSPPRVHRNSHQHMPKFLRSAKAPHFLASCTFPSYYCRRGKLEFPLLRASHGPTSSMTSFDMNILSVWTLCYKLSNTLWISLIEIFLSRLLSCPGSRGANTTFIDEQNAPLYSPSHGVLH